MTSREILFAVASFIAISAHADFPTAVKDYREKNYSFAYAGFLESATLGDGAAQYNLAAMTWQGHGLPRDAATALGWLKAAATNGYSSPATRAPQWNRMSFRASGSRACPGSARYPVET